MTTEKRAAEHSCASPCSPCRYWYDEARNVVWPYDGTYSGDDHLRVLVDRDSLMPILDILPRLWSTGHTTVEQDGKWWLFDSRGEGLTFGTDFRDLCINIILAGF